MNDAINPALAVFLKDTSHCRLICQIDSMRVDLRGIFVLLCRVFRERFACDLLQLVDGPRV